MPRWADALGIRGGNDQEKLDNLCAAIEELKARVGIKATIGTTAWTRRISWTTWMRWWSRHSTDQCTGAQPPLPPVSENQGDVPEGLLRRIRRQKGRPA